MQLPVHFVSEAAGGEPLRVGGISALLSRLCVVLKLLNDVPDAAGPDCQHTHYFVTLMLQLNSAESAERADVYIYTNIIKGCVSKSKMCTKSKNKSEMNVPSVGDNGTWNATKSK